MRKSTHPVLFAVIAAVLGLGALGLQGCMDGSPYYAQHEHREWMSERHLECDADGDRCVRCDADGLDCEPVPGVYWHHRWDPYS